MLETGKHEYVIGKIGDDTSSSLSSLPHARIIKHTTETLHEHHQNAMVIARCIRSERRGMIRGRILNNPTSPLRQPYMHVKTNII
jgi:hypothetical protein